jgi:hypothetical protein
MLSSGIIPPSNRLNAINKMNTVGATINKGQKNIYAGGNILTIDQDPLSQFKPLNNGPMPLGLGNKRRPPPTLPQAVPISNVVNNNRQKNFGTQGILMLQNGNDKGVKI